MPAKLVLAATALAVSSLAGSQAGKPSSPDSVTPPVLSMRNAEARAQKLIRLRAKYLRHLAEGKTLADNSEQTIRGRGATLLTLAVCLKFASCDEPEATRQAYMTLLDEMTRTHITGGGATASGEPWGHRWQSSYWTWHAAFSAWLMWPELTPARRNAVLKMAIDEADRFIDMPAPYARFFDTRGEENAWNSMLLVLMGEILEHHPHHQRWRERGREYMISAYATEADRHSRRIVDGKPLAAWLRGANAHPDYTVENHGFVHPDYIAAIGFSLTNALVYRLLNRPVPEAVTFNAQPIYNVLKFFTAADGGMFYPNSADWSLHRLDLTWSMGVQMDRLRRDPQAGALAALAFDTLEGMHERNGDGRMFASYEFPTYKTIEPVISASLDVALMFARLWAPARPTEPLATVWKQLEGARIFDDGRLFVARTPRGISSFSWGTRVMGVTQPFTKDPIIWPINLGYFGFAEPPAAESTAGGGMSLGSKAFEQAVRREPVSVYGVIHGSENGATFVTVHAGQAGRTKVVSFTALPSGKSVFIERIDGDTRSAWGGLIGLMEEPEWIYARPRRTIERGGNRWVNVDGRLGYAMSGNGGVEVVPGVRSHLLILNKAPESGSIAAIVTLPGANVAETREFAARPFQRKVRQEGVTAVEVDGLLIMTNTVRRPTIATVESSTGPLEIPVNGWATTVVRR